ncbi:inhibitor of apoptosis repeat-containing protein [Mycena leptocephala]|nr:inhibitor of apoptosis repeat-containing protein [Mycena leptocephala]
MEVLNNRLNSFLKQKRGNHPRTLAEAGFYFDPSTDDPDNWAEEDDPFDIHWQKCANVCAWANLRCGLRRDTDSHGSPATDSKAMEKARLETFTAHGWMHDKNKKHMATSKKMAHAGFVFTPAEAGDDTGACLYCHVALEIGMKTTTQCMSRRF